MFSKKFMSKLAVVALLATSILPANTFATTQFSDVDSLDPAYKVAINFMNGLGIMVGSTDKSDDSKTKFSPDDKVTRAQVSKIIDLALGYGKVVDAANVKNLKFPDVDKAGWAAKYIAVANERGFIKGSSTGKFNPDGNVTYAEYATMVVRALGYDESDLTGTWPLNYITKATDLGVFDSLKEVPYDQPALRKDIAVMTQNMLYTPTKADAENDKYVYSGSATMTNPNGDQDKRPRWLIDDVASKIGVAYVVGAVVTDSSIDSSYTDKVKIVSNYTDCGNTNLQKDYTFAIPDEDKKRFSLGSSVAFFYNTNIGAKNAILFDVDSNPTPTVDATVTSTTGASITTKVKPTDGAEVATTKSVNGNTLYVLNGKYWNNQTNIVANGSTFNNAKLGAVVQNAKVKEYDYDGNGTVDFVVANNEVRPQVVAKDFVSSDTAIKVYDAFVDSVDDTSISVDASKVKVTGDVTKVTDIKANDVIYVTKVGDGTVTNIDVKRQVVDGTITAINYSNGNPSSIVVNGTTYDFDTNVPNVNNTTIVQNARVKFLAGKVTADSVNAKFIRYADYTSAGFDLANYGIVTSVVPYGGGTWAIVNVSTLTGGNKSFTVNVTPASLAAYQAMVNDDRVYKIVVPAAGLLTLTPASGAGVPAELSQSFYTGNVTTATRSFGIMTDASGNRSLYDLGVLSPSDLTNRVLAVSTAVYSITDINASAQIWNGYQYVGGYKAVVFKITSTPTSYNFVSAKGVNATRVSSGNQPVNGVMVNVDQYTVTVDGNARTIYVNPGLAVPQYFNGYYVGANGIVYGFDALAFQNVGPVLAVAAPNNLTITVLVAGVPTVYDLAPNVQLYVNGVLTDISTLGSLTNLISVDYVIAPASIYGNGPNARGYVYVINVRK